MRHLIDSLDLSVAETQEILDLADRIAADSAAYAHCADGKILATLFYEPSTRTRTLAAEHWDLPVRNSAVPRKVRRWQIPHGWSAAMQISLPCGIRKREHRSELPCIPGFR